MITALHDAVLYCMAAVRHLRITVRDMYHIR